MKTNIHQILANTERFFKIPVDEFNGTNISKFIKGVIFNEFENIKIKMF